MLLVVMVCLTHKISDRLAKIFSIKTQKGVTLIEYALIAALIGVALIAALTNVGTELKTTFSTIVTKLTAART